MRWSDQVTVYMCTGGGVDKLWLYNNNKNKVWSEHMIGSKYINHSSKQICQWSD
uniref:Uncharacterized protein n=1 Tax=Zea mays TaxID=4577 RepID=C0HDV8_MAIZE|nr:unknown [Zea mays]